MKITKAMLAAAVACGTMFSTVVYAEEEATPDFALDTVVVTANRMENKLVDTPANVSVVTSEEIERRNYQDAIEAVKNVPGVNVLEGAKGDDHFITIGGSERVLVMVDGRRVGSSQGFASGKAKVDVSMLPSPNMIERIEIVKGGGSTVYGADAVGGVINIITKKADAAQAKLDINTGSWGTQNYKGYFSQKQGKTGITIAASKAKQNYMKYKEAESGDNLKLQNSNSQKISTNIKLEQEIGSDQLITLTYDHLNKKGGRPGNLGPYFDPIGTGHKIDNNVAVKYDWNTNSDKAGYVQIYRNNSVNDWLGKYDINGTLHTKENRTGIDAQQSILTNDSNNLVVGASYYKSKVDTSSTYYGNPTNAYDESINNKAIYVQDSWDFASTWKLNTGLRYDNHSKAGSKTTGSVAVNKKFTEDSHAYIAWSQIFNVPSTDDLFYLVDYGGGSGSFGNPDLKPETGDIWTIGYETKIGKKTNLGVSAFYSELDDAINWVSNYIGGYWHYSRVENVDKQKRRGLELSYKYDFDDNWSMNASYAYVKVENKYGNGEYTRDFKQLPNQYKLGVSYNNAKWNVDLYGRGANGGAKATYVDSKYLTMDLSVNYKVKDNWKLYAKGYNLTNVAYAEMAGTYTTAAGHNAYTYPAAGRAFLIGTELTF